ncbi:MAG: signal peptidase I [Clostridia bacterium]|nr:signal peptidase I [Clostridia bacterium]
MKNKQIELPTSQEIQGELKRERNKMRYKKILKSTVYALIIVAAVAVLIATLVMPVLQISGTSMEPTLENGQIVALIKTNKLDRGDLCGFYYSNKILIKRVIGLPGDVIVIDAEGTVYVNNIVIDEPYLTEKMLGDCDLEFPYTVPEQSYFVLGDQRSNSVDSRNSVVGSIPFEDVMGKVVIRVWPFSDIGFVS